MKILIIEDDEQLGDYLQRAARARHHEVALEAHGDKALEAYTSLQPDLILCDINVPGTDGFKILEKVRDLDSRVIFVIMTGYGSEDYAVRALHLQANNYLNKPISNDVFLGLLEKYETQIRSTQLRREVIGSIQSAGMRVSVGNDLEKVSAIVQQLLECASYWIDDHDKFRIQLGLFELIVNAIEHGNLEISYDIKQDAMVSGLDKYTQILKERRTDPALEKRTVSIDFAYQDGMLSWLIRDEGPGFDWSKVPNPLSPLHQNKLNGRGIFLARIQFDKLEYLGKGNMVRAVTEARRPREPRAG